MPVEVYVMFTIPFHINGIPKPFQVKAGKISIDALNVWMST